jgi:hypothetical protein
LREREQTVAPCCFETADQQRSAELSANERQAVENVLEAPFVKEQLGPAPEGPIEAHRAQPLVEQSAHGGACAAAS